MFSNKKVQYDASYSKERSQIHFNKVCFLKSKGMDKAALEELNKSVKLDSIYFAKATTVTIIPNGPHDYSALFHNYASQYNEIAAIHRKNMISAIQEKDDYNKQEDLESAKICNDEATLQYDAVIHCYNRAVSVGYGYSKYTMHFNQAKFLYEIGKKEEALQAYTAAIDLYPEPVEKQSGNFTFTLYSKEAYKGKISLLKEMGRNDEAEEVITIYKQKNPSPLEFAPIVESDEQSSSDESDLSATESNLSGENGSGESDWSDIA
jgi:tetratricopeptide (TPR) repeat protein